MGIQHCGASGALRMLPPLLLDRLLNVSSASPKPVNVSSASPKPESPLPRPSDDVDLEKRLLESQFRWLIRSVKGTS